MDKKTTINDKKNIVLVIQFRGQRFSGWQRQKNAQTVQETLENGIEQLTGQHLITNGCSRTDAGVHARLMVTSLHGPNLPLSAYCLGLNPWLPHDVKVINTALAPEGFSARFSTTGKTYCYRVLNAPVAMPMLSINAWTTYQYLNVEKMSEAGALLHGEHDFSSFRAAADKSPHSIRYIKEIRITRRGRIVEIWVTGNAFLTNMVRIIAGTLVSVGLGKHQPSWVKDVLDARDRTMAGQTLPANGLTLESVYYAPEDLKPLKFLFDDPFLKPVAEVIWKRRHKIKI